MEIAAICMWCIFCGLLCFLLPTATSSDPKISTVDGNLIIKAGTDKNITLSVGAENHILFGKRSLKTLVNSIEKQGKAIQALGHGRKCLHNGNFITTGGVTYCACQGDWFGGDCAHKKPTECKFELTHKVGVISSPGYPFTYPPNTECTWKITAPPLALIEIFVIGVGIGTTTSCGDNGYLRITDNADLDRKLCGVSTTQELVAGDELTLTFKTGDERPVGTGFSLLYSMQVNKICGGHLTTVAGTIASPEYDNPIACGWFIDTKSTEPIQLTFDVMTIINQGRSCANHFAIYAGSNSDAPLVRKICHNTEALTFTLQSNKAFIKFVSAGAGNRFHGSYDIICGGATFLLSGSLDIQSPSYPNAYPNKKMCTWHIKGAAESQLAVRFVAFDVEPHPSCTYDMLALFDGRSRASRKLATYCGNQTPLPVITSDQNLMIMFQSDGDKDFRGFKATVDVVKPGCGGIFHGGKGVIHTPPVESNGSCYYTISSDKPDNAIQLSFARFYLRVSDYCVDEYIQLFHGQVASGNPRKHCGAFGPPVFLSEKRSITVKFFSKAVNIDTMFIGEWESIAKPAGCNIGLTGVTGTVQSVNYPNNYDANLDCRYTITAETGHLIKLMFDVFSMEHHVSCVNDYLAIYDGADERAPLLGTFCGARSPSVIVSSSNKLFLYFKTDLSGEDKGFHAEYTTGTNLCGGFLHQDNGFITSPNYPQPYRANEECVWYIQSSEGNFIDLTIREFSLEDHSPCSAKDYVRIYDGENRESKMLAELCGDQEPKTHFRSSGHNLMIEFKSDGDMQMTGRFDFFFTSGCGEVFDAPSGVIQTPNYPNNYPSARMCKWEIHSHGNDIVNIESEDFQLQPSPSCEFDYLEIHSGSTKKYCGSQGPSSSLSGTVYLKFESDARITNKGFKLRYTISGCSGDLTTPSGNFSSPNFPNNYPASSYCRWRITVAEGKRVELTMPSVRVGKCSDNTVTVYNGGDMNAPVLHTYCNHPHSIKLSSSSNKLTVLFKSQVANVGFRANYKSVPGGCGGEIVSASGFLHSPGYPGYYPKNAECIWNIKSPVDRSLKLTFQQFDVFHSVNCSRDYLKVVDGTTSALIGKFCGSSIPLPQASTSNEMDVTFVSDGHTSGKGFKVHYQTGCGGTIEVDSVDSSGYINTPGFPNNNTESICVWHLKGKDGNKVLLRFDTFNLDSGHYGVCDVDYVQIYNGDSTQAPLINTYCGQSIPDSVTSTGSSLYVKFYANNKVNHISGFKAEYTSLFTGCGGDLTGHKGSFANTMYPQKSVGLEYCEYYIKVAAGNKISLNFEVVDLGMDNSDICGDGIFLKVFEGGVNKLTTCQSTPADFESETNEISVLFSSYGLGESKFKLNYRTVCQMEISQQTRGTIQSPNYPNAYPHDIACFWRISAPQSINVNIEFESFQLEARGGGVCRDYVQIYDEFLTLVDTYCGPYIPSSTTSTGESLSIRFVSDGAVSSGGFSFQYSYTTDPTAACGGVYTATSVPSYISSPNYPLPYPTMQSCIYQIDVIPGTSVKLTFVAFNLEDSYVGRCYFDIVDIYETDNDIATLCGTMGVNETYHSIGSQLSVKFTSDESDQSTGFKAKIERVCGGVLKATKGRVRSPQTDGKYSPLENCTWIIEQDSGSVIKLHFVSFDLEKSTDCRKDHLLIRNGLSSDSPLVGRYCGNDVPANYTSTGSTLFIQFISDYNVTLAAGFEIIYERYVHGCGDHLLLTDPTLTYELTSPGYPDTYANNIDCEWILRVPEGHVVDITFTEFVSNFTCSTDKVILHTGRNSRTPHIGTLCGSNLPHQRHFKSSYHEMYVRLLAGVKPEGKASFFKATWKIGCGGWHEASAGDIWSPSFPDQYPANSNCSYEVMVPGKKQVHLQFNTFSLSGTGTDCPDNGDYVEIFDADRNRTKIGRYCGNKLPDPIVGLTHGLAIVFISNGAGSSNGFKARFSTVGQVCGGSMYNTGTFQTPFHPHEYPLRRECTWIMQSVPGVSVRLKFETFNLESSVNCTGDRIVIRNGRHVGTWATPQERSPVIGTYCGTELPPIIHSSGNYLSLIFVSDSSPARGTGFKASFTSADVGCGGEITGKRGYISSPGYPTEYPISTECEWTITVPKTSVVKITLIDIDLEPPYYGTCYDYVQIKDAAGAVVAEKCDQKVYNGYSYTSFGSTITVSFTSDSTDSFPGFKLLWEAVVPTCTSVVVPIKVGEIVNPGYPGYGSDLECTWTWMEAEGASIALTFLDIDLLLSENCAVDSITIRNGHEADSPVIHTLCGNRNNSENRIIESSGNYMRLTFKTGHVANRTARGFKIAFNTRQEGCGGVLRSHSGNITSPNYPSTYPDSASCSWVIQTEVGSKIFVYIDDLDIEDHSKCTYDALELRDGESMNAPLITHLCGTDHNSVYTSTSNYMFILFRSDSLTGGRGFKIHYNIGCGGILKGKTGYARSPHYPNPYPPNQNCLWKIDLKREYHVKLTELDFDLPPHNAMASCVGTYVHIREGLQPSSPIIATFCGALSNQEYESPYHQLVIQFVSDNSTNTIYRGSNALYTAICGEKIVTDSAGVLKYPTSDTYPKNESCEWVIEFPVGEQVVLTTRSLDIEAYRNFHCVFDYLEIRDGKDESAPLFGRFCGKERPPVLKSSSNYVYIKFVSDASVSRAGFEIHYSKEIPDNTCGGYLTAPSGNITSPGYPNVFPTNLNCGWRIVQPEGKIINLTFTKFVLTKPLEYYGNYRDCSNYIRVFDSDYPDERHSRINITCGDQTGYEFQSLSNKLYISFHSYDKTVSSDDGFLIDYVSANSGCGGVLKLHAGETKNMTSPGYPESIAAGPKCQWFLKAPAGYQLTITLDEIDTPTFENGSCPRTYLKLYDGVRGTARSFCGDKIKGMTLQTSMESALFILTRETVGNPFKLRIGLIQGCNHTITATSGMVTSTNYPYGGYLHQATCHYFITAPEGQTITLYPITFDVEAHADCKYDYLEINDGADSSAPMLGKKYCGTDLPPTFSSSGNKMHLLFSTDKGYATAGFGFTYVMSSSACGGNVTGELGSLTTPNYPRLYNGQYECEWDITVSSGMKINVTIAHLELESPAAGADCTTVDYLEIFDGSASFGKFCGSTHMSRLTTTSNKAKVIFISNDVHNMYRGFQLFYYETL